MTRNLALAALRDKAEQMQAAGLDALVDESEMMLFLPVAEEHRDYVMLRALPNGEGWRLEQCFDAEAGTTILCRAWLTPQEWVEKHRAG